MKNIFIVLTVLIIFSTSLKAEATTPAYSNDSEFTAIIEQIRKLTFDDKRLNEAEDLAFSVHKTAEQKYLASVTSKKREEKIVSENSSKLGEISYWISVIKTMIGIDGNKIQFDLAKDFADNAIQFDPNNKKDYLTFIKHIEVMKLKYK